MHHGILLECTFKLIVLGKKMNSHVEHIWIRSNWHHKASIHSALWYTLINLISLSVVGLKNCELFTAVNLSGIDCSLYSDNCNILLRLTFFQDLKYSRYTKHTKVSTIPRA